MCNKTFCKDCGGLECDDQDICHCDETKSHKCSARCPECETELEVIVPIGKQIISEEAIKWLFENHREIYDGFYERL